LKPLETAWVHRRLSAGGQGESAWGTALCHDAHGVVHVRDGDLRLHRAPAAPALQRGVGTRPTHFIGPTLATFWALSPASEHMLLGAMAVFWALPPASEHGILGTVALFWGLSPASAHGVLGTSPPWPPPAPARRSSAPPPGPVATRRSVAVQVAFERQTLKPVFPLDRL
jgi:hypothetical protein